MSIPFAVRRIPVIFGVAIVFALWGSYGFATGARRSVFQESGSAESTGRHSSIAEAPLSFEANLGQTWQEARFLARGFGYNLFFATDGVLIRLGSKASRQGIEYQRDDRQVCRGKRRRSKATDLDTHGIFGRRRFDKRN